MNLTTTPGGRRLLFGLLYFAEGAPIGFLWWALPAYLRLEDRAVAEITTLTAALAVPWSIKFLWAPLVDWSGKRREWTIVCQLLMGLTLGAAAFAYVDGSLRWAALLLLLHALSAATQDVSIDAWAIAATPPDERGRLTAAMQAGMLSGRWLFGAGLLLVIDRIGLLHSAAALVGVLWALMAFVWAAGRSGPKPSGGIAFHEMRSRIRGSFSHARFWLGIAFALIAGAGFEAVGAVAGPYLVDRGFDAERTGWFLSGTVVLMLTGAWLGGRLADRGGARRAAAAGLALIAAMGLLLAVADAADSDLRYLALGGVYLAIGVFTASSYALFMNLTDPRLGGFQFSAFMAATNACEAWAAFSVGRLIAHFDYAVAFAVMAALSLVAAPLLYLLRTPNDRGHATIEST